MAPVPDFPRQTGEQERLVFRLGTESLTQTPPRPFPGGARLRLQDLASVVQ
jgi:hypothetical protein